MDEELDMILENLKQKKYDPNPLEYPRNFSKEVDQCWINFQFIEKRFLELENKIDNLNERLDIKVHKKNEESCWTESPKIFL